MSKQCTFCKIVDGTLPSHKVWEDSCHLAFLSIYPNTPGVTVVISKQHQNSYVFNNEPKTIQDLIEASRCVARMLEQAYNDVGRVGLVFEGFGIDHLHAKLYPLHGTQGSWRNIPSMLDTFYEKYMGYISSHDGPKASDRSLAVMAAKISQFDEKYRDKCSNK